MNRRTILKSMLLMPLLRFRWTEDGTPPNQTFRLFIVGDWGTGGKLQKRVAKGMSASAIKSGVPVAIISTGDNIYPDGVNSADDPQWQTKFENVYNEPMINHVPWVAVLGNHDYRKSIMAQVEYARKNPRWIMPSTYYSHRLMIDSETTVSIICLDTQQILQKKAGWKKQIAWLEHELPQHIKSKWIIAVGHHPIRSYGYYGDQAGLVNSVKPLLDKHNVGIYACGHDHDLQVIKNPADEFYCIVSGGGGGYRETTSGNFTLASATNGGFVQLVFNRESVSAQIMNADGNTLHDVNLRIATKVK